MAFSPSPTSPARSRSRPLLAVLLALGMSACLADAKTAGAAPATPEIRAGDEHGHSCKCGPRCRGASCCCAPRRPSRPSPPSPPGPTAVPEAPADAGPCFAAAPCGDPAAPENPAASPSVKVAALTLPAALPTREAGRRLGRGEAPPLPSRMVFRPERPPRVEAAKA